ncbi:MAG: AraC family transcriptional regulator [Dorea sp.]|jgi:AraC-like DNA-binding protein|nr:AraC family transcriptional regulator [Dorea sp.]
MKLSSGHTSTKYENKQHGSSGFPYAVYRSLIPDIMHSYPLHWHNEMEITYILKGSCLISVNGTPIRAQAGDIILILPNQLHSIDQNEDCRAEYYTFVFDLQLLGQDSPSDACFCKYLKPYLDGGAVLPFRLPYEHADCPPIRQSLEGLLKLETPEQQKNLVCGKELRIKSGLFSLFSLLEPFRQNTDSDNGSLYQLAQIQKMKALLRFISANYMTPLTLREAAAFCGYSASYFMKFFKSFTSSTFVEYLNHYRLEKAGELLRETTLSILEISEQVGFENHSYFIRIFKRQYGITPRKYRLLHKDPGAL